MSQAELVPFAGAGGRNLTPAQACALDGRVTTTALHRMAGWACELRLDDVPQRVREQAKNQILSTLGATHAGYASDLGPRLAEAFPPPRGDAVVLPSGDRSPPVHAAFLMAAWSMVLDFDDSMLGGHTGHSTVLVPLAYASGRTGDELLRAQIVANELAARVNTAVALGPLRGQMATHVHLVGAAAARAALERLEPGPFAEAVGFALTYPAKALYPGFLGSDAKLLSASWPVRMGTESVDAVRAGLRGNPRVLDGRRGFLSQAADVPLPEFLGGLGERWHTETNSFKVYPGCAYIDAVVDATLAIVRRYDVAAEDITEVDVHASILTIGMDLHSAPYLRGPESLVSTLSFSTPYNVACAIRDRDLRPEHLTRPKITDTATWELAGKVRLHHDEALTIAALTSDAPLGAALKLAGSGALRYVMKMAGARRGIPKPRDAAAALRLARAVVAAGTGTIGDLSRAEKAVGARVRIRTGDGRSFTEEVRVPVGAAGSGDHAALRELMRAKYLAAAGPVCGDKRAAEAAGLVERLEELDAEAVETLLAACLRTGRRRATARRGGRRQTSPSGGTPPAADPAGS